MIYKTRFYSLKRYCIKLTNEISVLLFIVLIFLLKVNIYSKCASGGIYFWPNGNTIRQNSLIVIEGYAESQEIISALNKLYPVYLKSSKGKIPLKVKAVYTGEFRITQAILKPEKTLTAGMEYEFHIDNLPNREKSIDRYNDKTGKYEPVKWKVIEGVDKEKPIWKSKPKIIEKKFIRYGCGPEIEVIFSCDVIDKSEFLIKAVLTKLKTNRVVEYYLTPSKNKIYVGHDMCSGAFTFDESDEYEIDFSLLDASGNFTPWEGKEIRFYKPIDNKHQPQK